MMTELRALLRILWRQRASSGAAVLMMSCAIAGASATFAVANAALWRALPYHQPRELQLLVTTHPDGEAGVSLPDFLAARDVAVGRVAAAASLMPLMTLTGFGEPRLLRARMLSADYFRTLGVRLTAGRDFSRDEETLGRGTVVIVTDRLSRTLFTGRSTAIGASLALNSRAYTVVGVLPAHRDFLGDVDLYIPYQFAPTLPRSIRLFVPIARVAPQRVELFREELRRQTLAPSDPDAKDHVVTAVDLAGRLSSAPRSRVLLLFGAGIGLLAIATLNLAMLVAARVCQRQQELATRVAIGATAASIVRLVVAEAAALCVMAGCGSLVVSSLLLPLLAERYGTGLVNDVAFDQHAVVFSVAVTGAALLAVVLFVHRMPPRLASSRRISVSRLASGRGLVVAQLAVSLALAAGSALFVRSFVEQQRVDPGFQIAERFTSRLGLPLVTYATPMSRHRFWDALLQRLSASGMAAALASELPLTGQDNPTVFAARLANGVSVTTKTRAVSDRYFELMGIPIRAGRALSATDRDGAPFVVVVNERLRQLLPSPGSPLGQTMTFDFGAGPQPATVVGVVGDIRHSALDLAPVPEAYFTFHQTPLTTLSILLASNRDARAVTTALQATLKTIDAGRAFEPVQPYAAHVERSLNGSKLQAQALMAFALMATIVATSGLYSLLTYLINGTRREWAIRLAVGATSRQLQAAVVLQSIQYTLAGLLIGIVLLAVVGSSLSRVLYGVTLWDPLAAASLALILAIVSVTAAALPARQAGRISAAESLQAQ